MKKSDIKCGVIAVLLLMAMAIVFILWCVGTWDDNAGYAEVPQESWEIPTVCTDGLKVQELVCIEPEETEDEHAEETEQVAAKLESPATSTVYEQTSAEIPKVSQVSGTYYDAIPLSAELQAVLFECCAEHGIRPELALALIETESQFDPYVESYSECYGLCQLNPVYFPSGLSPADNIRYGMEYLGRQIRAYGSEAAGLTAYTVGHDNGSRNYANVVLSRAPAWETIIG